MIRINITLKEEDLKLVDALARKDNKTRSEFLRSVVRYYKSQMSLEKERDKMIKKAITTQDELRTRKIPWDATSELRRQRKRNR
ncbi:MAG: ribbon-helix-helix protein, CopG family [Thermodesulfobacteriota bacterium]